MSQSKLKIVVPSKHLKSETKIKKTGSKNVKAEKSKSPLKSNLKNAESKKSNESKIVRFLLTPIEKILKRKNPALKHCEAFKGDKDAAGTHQVLIDVMTDLQCVFEKAIKETKLRNEDNTQINEKIEKLKAEVAELEECNESTEIEICTLESELLTVQKNLKCEVQRKQALENIIVQVNLQMNQLKSQAEMECAERREIEAYTVELRRRVKQGDEAIAAMKEGNTELLQRVRSLQTARLTMKENGIFTKQQCKFIREDLAEVNEKIDDVSIDINDYKEEIDGYNQKLLKCQNLVRKRCEDFKEKQRFNLREKSRRWKIVLDHKSILDKQTEANIGSFKRNEVLTKEIECWKRKGNKYFHRLQKENTAKETTENKLHELQELRQEFNEFS